MNPIQVVEAALLKQLRLRLGKRALTDAMLDRPIPLSGREAEDAARIAVDALAGAGLVLASACTCGQPIGTCPSCGEPRCWHCNPGLGKHYEPMKCNDRHEPARAALPERTENA